MGKEYDVRYLNQQFSAMRWLAMQGLEPAEIRVMRWGSVDEVDKTIRINQKMFFIRLDKETGVVSRMEDEKEIRIPIKGSGHEWFFLKSKFKCPWMFTEHPPKTWRKEGSKEALFPLEVVENACRDLATPGISVLTFAAEFGNIEVSKLNITNPKPEGLIEEAEVVMS